MKGTRRPYRHFETLFSIFVRRSTLSVLILLLHFATAKDEFLDAPPTDRFRRRVYAQGIDSHSPYQHVSKTNLPTHLKQLFWEVTSTLTVEKYPRL